MLDAKLRKLRLGHAASVLEAHHQGAINEKLGYLEFLERLVDDELSTRENKGMDKRMRAARFPVLKTFEEFDFAFQPSLDAMRVKALASCDFVTKQETVLLVGPPGVDKESPRDRARSQSVLTRPQRYLRDDPAPRIAAQLGYG